MTLTGARTVALPRFGLFATCLTIVIFTAPYITKGFHAIGPIEKLLGETTYTASDLRWAVFSISLVFIMVLRPQGMMGHHELSWAFIKSLFTGRAGKGARA
jgi:ABC-type branched-subunit amino acid transport system permease subunit